MCVINVNQSVAKNPGVSVLRLVFTRVTRSQVKWSPLFTSKVALHFLYVSLLRSYIDRLNYKTNAIANDLLFHFHGQIDR